MHKFGQAARKMREFFENKGFIEVQTQARMSILAACEDPHNLATYNYSGHIWPLPQTGQMWLEHDLLKNPELPGLYTISTSYRNEPNPKPGRHDKIFPMFEFEMHGGIDELRQMEADLLKHLGFPQNGLGDDGPYLRDDYENVAAAFGVKELEDEHEERLWKDHGAVFFLENFPEYTSPFWNMKRNGDLANKIDVILYGIETIGSAERETDKDIMRERFHTISNGDYAKTLFSQFGRDRVLKELDEFLSFDFFPRSGGGIGMTRMMRALGMLEKIDDFSIKTILPNCS